MWRVRRSKTSEHDEQAALIQWTHTVARYVPEILLLHAIPNGGKRELITAQRLRAEGVKPGVPDLFLPVPRYGKHGLYLEMKGSKRQPSSIQQHWIRDLRAQGYRVEVCYGWVEAAKIIAEYLGNIKVNF